MLTAMGAALKKQITEGLSVKDQVFCDAILAGRGHAEACIEAGHSAASARTTAPRLLRKAAVVEYLAEQRSARATKTEVGQGHITQELSKLAFSNVEDFTRLDADGLRRVDFSTATRDQLAAVTSIKNKKRTSYNKDGEVLGVEEDTEFKLADKYRGLELLGRHLGMFETKTTVVVDVADRLLRARNRMLNVTDMTKDTE